MKTNYNTLNQAILLMTDKDSSVIREQYEALKSTEMHSDVVVMYHQKGTPVPVIFNDTNYITFTNAILTGLKFNPIGNTLVPGNNHFPLLKFYQENQGYEYYWVIEDDVRFSGNWALLFDTFKSIDYDFISSDIRCWEEEPNWYWWNTLTHPTKNIPMQKRIASFNTIYRISNIALKFITQVLLDNWCGHHEVLLPTLLKYGGYSIVDFGGNGKFVLPDCINKFYISSRKANYGTMNYRPALEKIGDIPDKLYHPIKDFNCNSGKHSKAQVLRNHWISYMDKIAFPVIKYLAEDKLRENFSVFLSKQIDNPSQRRKVAYLEAFGRTLSGIAPWLSCKDGDTIETGLRNQYRAWSLKAIANAVNPEAKDYMLWTGGQPLVDASYFALALIRCPWLWENLESEDKNNVIKALLMTRSTIPCYMNWILFSGMIEAFFCKYGYEYDPVRIEYGIREFANHWYVGDGMFSDGIQFHLDYYNSFVIHPYLANILDAVKDKTNAFNWFIPKFDKITKRYAEIQERMINTDGSFPVTGRSIVYRGAVFHHLADIAWRKQLPASLKPAQVREALTAVINKTMEHPLTFTPDGWLNIGLRGKQSDLANFYITTGSLYICNNIFLPLGLSCSDEFWTSSPELWTAVKVWNGYDVPADSALDRD